MEGSCASYLPPEIWQMIFHGFDHEGELAHLWTWGRLVSWQFRNNIELVFATKWLQETVINFDLGKPGSLVEDRPHCAPTLITVHKGRPRGHRDITCTFQFKCFVADQYSEKAIWKLDEDREKHNECIREELSGVMLRHDRLIRAAHSIVLLLEKNDTVLPELEWDPAQHEILMDWRRMYNKFLGEKNAYDRDLSNAVCPTDTTFLIVVLRLRLITMIAP